MRDALVALFALRAIILRPKAIIAKLFKTFIIKFTTAAGAVFQHKSVLSKVITHFTARGGKSQIKESNT